MFDPEHESPDPNDPVSQREQELMAALAGEEPEVPLRVTVSERQGIPIVSLVGELDIATRDGFQKKLAAELERQPPGVVVDLSQTAYIDSSGLAVLMRAARQLPGRVAVATPRERILRLFQATGLSQSIGLYHTVAEAVAGLLAGERPV